MDDFAAMGEMVSRRFARLAHGATAEEYDESFATTPNLVVVDGGKGQLAAALAAMQAFDLPRVAVIALAKREEEVFVPGRASRSSSRGTTRASSSCSGSATRHTASRSASTGSGASRAASRRCSTSSRASARRGGGRSSTTSARSTRCSPRRPMSSRASRACRRRSRAASTRSCTKPAVGAWARLSYSASGPRNG